MANVVCDMGRNLTVNAVNQASSGSGSTVPKYIGIGSASGTSAATDEALFTEYTTSTWSGYARVAGTVTLTNTGTNFGTQNGISHYDTLQVVGTFTAGAAQTVTNAALFDTSTLPATTTLTNAGGINSSVTSMTVASAAGFPASGNYAIQIDSEILIVTGGQGTTTWTVARGAFGSTAASHAQNAVVSGTTDSSNNLLSIYAKGDFTGIPLANGDTLTLTFKIQYA